MISNGGALCISQLHLMTSFYHSKITLEKLNVAESKYLLRLNYENAQKLSERHPSDLYVWWHESCWKEGFCTLEVH